MLALAGVALALVYFLGFPVWSKAHLDEARLVLLDPEQSDALFSSLWFGQDGASGLAIAPEAAQRALTHYDAAARFAPFNDDIALERDLVRLVLNITTRPAPGPVALDTSADLPLTTHFAAHPDSGWTGFETQRVTPDFDDKQLRAASGEDLRSLGFVALLCGHPKLAMRAWSELDLKGSSDPMVEASFGMVYLISKQHGRAYPRLRKAVEVFPNVGFLTVYLAEAATKCGDFEKAQQWLNEAVNMPRLDRFHGLKRVQAGLYAASSKDADARRVYEELLGENKNLVAFDEYAQFLERQGDLERALIVYLRIIRHGRVDLNLYRRFIAQTELGWWVGGLAEADRQQLLAASEPLTTWRIDRNGILPTYAKCISEIGETPPPDGVPYPPKGKAAP
jgi:tetratricopeptide (TPR) repeat protein